MNNCSQEEIQRVATWEVPRDGGCCMWEMETTGRKEIPVL